MYLGVGQNTDPQSMDYSPWTTHMDYPKWTAPLKFSDQD